MKMEIIYEVKVRPDREPTKLSIRKEDQVMELNPEEIKELFAVLEGNRVNLHYYKDIKEYSPYKIIACSGGKADYILYDEENSNQTLDNPETSGII